MSLHNAMDLERYNRLSTPADRASFIGFASDFMVHVRSLRPGQNERDEVLLAQRFLELIDKDEVWPLVAILFPEKRAEGSGEKDLSEPLRLILDQLQHRLPMPVGSHRRSLIPAWQAEAAFDKIVHRIEYMAQLADRKTDLDKLLPTVWCLYSKARIEEEKEHLKKSEKMIVEEKAKIAAQWAEIGLERAKITEERRRLQKERKDLGTDEATTEQGAGADSQSLGTARPKATRGGNRKK